VLLSQRAVLAVVAIVYALAMLLVSFGVAAVPRVSGKLQANPQRSASAAPTKIRPVAGTEIRARPAA
jgi:hypothetical protein